MGLAAIIISFILLIILLIFNLNYTRSLAIILVVGLLLRIYCSSDPFLHPWDERYHALVAKNMITHKTILPYLYIDPVVPASYKNWYASGIWLHKQPMTLWLMAGSMTVFGKNEFAVRIPSILFSSLAIILIFLIGRDLFGTQVGILASGFHSINGLVLDLTSGRKPSDHIDISFFFFILLSIYFALIRKNKNDARFTVFCGISTGIALLCKWLPALIVLPVYYLINNCSRRALYETFLIGAIALIVFLPWQIYTYVRFTSEFIWELKFNLLHFNSIVEGHIKPWYYHSIHAGTIINELLPIALFTFIFQQYKSGNLKSYCFLFAWIGIPYFFFSLAKTKLPGYLLFVNPALTLLFAWWIKYLIESSKTHFGGRKYVDRFLIIVAFILSARYCVERVKPFNKFPQEAAAAEFIKRLSLPKGYTLFNTQSPIECMFYHDGLAYDLIPDSASCYEFILPKENIFMIDDGNLPKWALKEARITKIKI